jgi:ABC-type nitrate/sulfonate/bicarbonate transport system substrate-binding protein
VSQIGSESHTFLKQVLARNGVSIDDVQILQAGGNPQAGQAMLSGAMNAATVDGTMVPAAERAGAVLLADGSELKLPSPRGITAAMRPWVERNRDVVRRFLHAYVEGVHFYKTQREETVRIFQKYMRDLSYEEADYLWQQGYDGHKPLPFPSDESIQAVIDREFEAQAAQLKRSDFYDASFLREIEQSGLVARLWQ